MGSWIVSNGWQLFHFILLSFCVGLLQSCICSSEYWTIFTDIQSCSVHDFVMYTCMWWGYQNWNLYWRETKSAPGIFGLPEICEEVRKIMQVLAFVEYWYQERQKKYAAASSEQWQYHGIVWRLVFNFDWSIRSWNIATPPPPPPPPPSPKLQSTTCNPYFPQIAKPDSKFHDTTISCWRPPHPLLKCHVCMV